MKQYKKYVLGGVFVCLVAVALMTPIEKSEAFWPFSKKENNVNYTGAVKNIEILPKSSITVVSPNGGETLKAGKSYTIKWKSKGISKKAGISIILEQRYEDMPVDRSFIATTTANKGSYKWTVPEPKGPFNNFRVVLKADRPYFSSDASDGEFKIIGRTQDNTAPEIKEVFIRRAGDEGDIKVGDSVSVTVKSFDADNDDLAWEINWGDETGMVEVCEVDHKQQKKNWEFETRHIWRKEGSYTVDVTVKDCRGESDKDATTVNIIGI